MPKSIVSVCSLRIEIIPNLEEVSEICVNKWGPEIGGKNPSYYPQVGDEVVLFGPAKVDPMPDSNHCLKIAANLGFGLPNVQGLAIAEILDKKFDFLPRSSFIMGFDHKDHLSFQKHHGHIVPCLEKDFDGNYRYLHFPWNFSLEFDEFILLYNKHRK